MYRENVRTSPDRTEALKLPTRTDRKWISGFTVRKQARKPARSVNPVGYSPTPMDIAADHKPRVHYGVTFATLAVAAISYALLQSLVAPALPTIQVDLNASTTGATWILTAYLLSACVVHADRRPAGRHVRQEEDAGVHACGCWPSARSPPRLPPPSR